MGLAFAQSDDPSKLLAEAKADLSKQFQPTTDSAMAKLEQANALWAKQNSKTPEYADSLVYMTLLMHHQRGFLSDSDATPLDEWKNRAAANVEKALEICHETPNIDPGLYAQALELKADLLGRGSAGSTFWDEAAEQRKKHIADLGNPAPSLLEQAHKMSEATTPPILKVKLTPDYSQYARLRLIKGNTLFSLVIDKNGNPQNIHLVKSLGYGLDEEAVEVVKHWHFTPATKDGEPVAVRVNIDLAFHLR